MEKLIAPQDEKKILLHSCCAPCTGSIVEDLLTSGIQPTLFFYNPNIQPKNEYFLRKQEVIKYALKKNIECIDSDYEPAHWLKTIEDLTLEPEGGARCQKCFDMRLLKTALFAKNNNYLIFATTLGISRWKNLDNVNKAGFDAAKFAGDVLYWDCNWRKDERSKRMYEVARKENFYKQEYCGCVFSLRDSNRLRQSQNKPMIEIGKKRYEETSAT